MFLIGAIGSIVGVQPLQDAAGPSPAALADIPGNYLELYQQAGAQYGVDPWILAAIGKIETDHGRSTLPGIRFPTTNTHGCCAGPMQMCVIDGCPQRRLPAPDRRPRPGRHLARRRRRRQPRRPTRPLGPRRRDPRRGAPARRRRRPGGLLARDLRLQPRRLVRRRRPRPGRRLPRRRAHRRRHRGADPRRRRLARRRHQRAAAGAAADADHARRGRAHQHRGPRRAARRVRAAGHAARPARHQRHQRPSVPRQRPRDQGAARRRHRLLGQHLTPAARRHHGRRAQRRPRGRSRHASCGSSTGRPWSASGRAQLAADRIHATAAGYEARAQLIHQALPLTAAAGTVGSATAAEVLANRRIILTAGQRADLARPGIDRAAARDA